MAIGEVSRAAAARPRDEQHSSGAGTGRARRFGEILKAAGAAAAGAIPGIGPVIVKAIPPLRGGSFDPNTVLRDGSSEALQYLELQRAISREARHYETLSNVMKARHEASMNTIRNLRS
jgi:hypothetical protein